MPLSCYVDDVYCGECYQFCREQILACRQMSFQLIQMFKSLTIIAILVYIPLDTNHWFVIKISSLKNLFSLVVSFFNQHMINDQECYSFITVTGLLLSLCYTYLYIPNNMEYGFFLVHTSGRHWLVQGEWFVVACLDQLVKTYYLLGTWYLSSNLQLLMKVIEMWKSHISVFRFRINN